MIIREIIMWLSIMRSNLKDFPEVGNDNKIKALSEALVIIHKYQKIVDIVSLNDEEFKQCGLKELKEILGVIADGTINSSDYIRS